MVYKYIYTYLSVKLYIYSSVNNEWKDLYRNYSYNKMSSTNADD